MLGFALDLPAFPSHPYPHPPLPLRQRENQQSARRARETQPAANRAPRIPASGGAIFRPARYGLACLTRHQPMAALAEIPASVLAKAGVAYGHELSFMLCFGALALERLLVKPDPDRRTATLLVIVDVVYGIAALTLLVSGIARVLHFGQGSAFYTTNPLFWTKVGLYLSVGALSLYPTITYILWAIPLRKGELPQVSAALATRLRWILNVELLGFAVIPLLASLMARGVGLPAA